MAQADSGDNLVSRVLNVPTWELRGRQTQVPQDSREREWSDRE